MKRYCVYIMSNKSRRVYTGITSDLPKRVFQHRYKLIDGFTSRYNFDMLVYFEEYSQVVSALTREKEIKGWRREKKLKLILAQNPDWADLSREWQEDPGWNLLPDARPRLQRKQAAIELNPSGSGADSSRKSTLRNDTRQSFTISFTNKYLYSIVIVSAAQADAFVCSLKRKYLASGAFVRGRSFLSKNQPKCWPCTVL